MPDISLIISVYNRVDALALILSALNTQQFKNFEIVIAEDNDAGMMKDFIAMQKENYGFTIKHVSQPDNGFQKNKILNEATKAAEGNYLVFIDGDCIPHREFLNQYHKLLQPKICLFGRRVMLSESFTKRILLTQQLQQINFMNLLLSGSKRLEDGMYFPFEFNFKMRDKGIWGCNFGILKQHMLDINGFDEDYTSANVGEDEDVEWRLRQIGVEFKRIKNRVVLYHLYHHIHYSAEDYRNNHMLMIEKIKSGNFFCKNGIERN
jgi:cellulose synthase/poly-beta-1,6-N-acetylglucosamine synthase-like glycosyltransferase